MKAFIIMWLKKWGLHGTFDTNKAIGDLKKENIALKKENEALRGFTIIYTDPNLRTKGYEQSAWNAEPEKHTDPNTPNMERFRKPPSRYAVYNKDMEQVTFEQRQRAGIPDIRTQHELPKLPRKLTLMHHSEPLPDATLSMPAAWML